MFLLFASYIVFVLHLSLGTGEKCVTPIVLPVLFTSLDLKNTQTSDVRLKNIQIGCIYVQHFFQDEEEEECGYTEGTLESK